MTMQWDLGWTGLGVLVLMALGFGVAAHLALTLLRQRPPGWLWAVASATYLVAGALISEVLFGWATEAELQPNIDGLSFDEVLLIGLLPGIAVVLVIWWLNRPGRWLRR
ncbi:MAG TPA: hypothetical protein VFM74_07640 [Candidatus Limnocylindria bacterium]|nr:hypothetical protein [Candidatus Limnocylindria bacterium]